MGGRAKRAGALGRFFFFFLYVRHRTHGLLHTILFTKVPCCDPVGHIDPPRLKTGGQAAYEKEKEKKKKKKKTTYASRA